MGSTARASMRALCGLTRQVAALGRAYHNSPVLSRIAQRFGIETPEGFYKFNRADVRRAFPRDKEVEAAFSCIIEVNAYPQRICGGPCYRRVAKPICAVLKELSPENNWLSWKFKRGVPLNFWDDEHNRVRYAEWLAGYRSAASWDQLNVDAVREHSGWGLLATYYGGSPRRFMKELVFEHLHPEPT